jgi:hypothetical protein
MGENTRLVPNPSIGEVLDPDSRIPVRHRRRTDRPWLTLGCVPTQVSAEAWVGRLLGRLGGEMAAGSKTFVYRKGRSLEVNIGV